MEEEPHFHIQYLLFSCFKVIFSLIFNNYRAAALESGLSDPLAVLYVIRNTVDTSGLTTPLLNTEHDFYSDFRFMSVGDKEVKSLHSEREELPSSGRAAVRCQIHVDLLHLSEEEFSVCLFFHLLAQDTFIL